MTPTTNQTNTCTLTKVQRAPIAIYSHYLGRTAYEIAPKPCNNRTDATSYTIVKLIIDPRIEVTIDNLGERSTSESMLHVMLVAETPIGARRLKDAAKFKAALCSREDALTRLDKLSVHAEAIGNERLLERWQGFKQQIENSADALFC